MSLELFSYQKSKISEFVMKEKKIGTIGIDEQNFKR